MAMNSNLDKDSKFARVFVEAQRIREKQEAKRQERLASKHLQNKQREEKKKTFLK